jgi:putative endonuclease
MRPKTVPWAISWGAACGWLRAIIGRPAGGGEIDLVLWDRDGTLVFVEVRKRASRAFGGALGSITAAKQRRIVFAARHYLLRLQSQPPCRFDVVCMEEGGGIQWMRAAFDAG